MHASRDCRRAPGQSHAVTAHGGTTALARARNLDTGALSLGKLPRPLARKESSAFFPASEAYFHASLTGEAWLQLAMGDHFGVRLAVAEHPQAPADALAALATDDSEFLRFDVVENPNTPAGTLALLAKDESVWVRYVVPSLTPTCRDAHSQHSLQTRTAGYA